MALDSLLILLLRHVNAPKVAGSPLVKRENSIIAVPRQSKHLKRKTSKLS